MFLLGKNPNEKVTNVNMSYYYNGSRKENKPMITLFIPWYTMLQVLYFKENLCDHLISSL